MSASSGSVIEPHVAAVLETMEPRLERQVLDDSASELRGNAEDAKLRCKS